MPNPAVKPLEGLETWRPHVHFRLYLATGCCTDGRSGVKHLCIHQVARDIHIVAHRDATQVALCACFAADHDTIEHQL